MAPASPVFAGQARSHRNRVGFWKACDKCPWTYTASSLRGAMKYNHTSAMKYTVGISVNSTA
ncbi:hypothetical protein PMI38_03149 [Pseudomonas sp. GM84]|nr:hypothetical protein PMI38_03149 [Pseudomonas sp. GM84]